MKVVRYRGRRRDSVGSAREFVFAFFIGVTPIALQQTAVFGEPDRTDRYVGWIGLGFGLFGLLRAAQIFWRPVVEVGPDRLLLRDPKTNSTRTVTPEAVEALRLSRIQGGPEYRLEVAVADGQPADIDFRSTHKLDDVLETIRRFHPATTLHVDGLE